MSIVEVKKASITSMDACDEPHGGVNASCLFTQQYSFVATSLYYEN